MRVVKLSIVLILSFLMLTPAWAVLNIELTQGVRSAIPIAIMPFSNQQKLKVPGGVSLIDVMTNDLENSGQFNVKPVTGLVTKGASNPTTAAQLDFGFWRKQKVDDVVIGSVTPIAGGQYQISYQLVNLYSKSAATAKADPNQSILLSETVTTNAQGLRSVAHHISDAVYKKLTGVNGIFNTKIAYVLVKGVTAQNAKYSLMVADYDGFNPKALMVSNEPIMSPTWSPEGENIAYVSFEGDQAAIFQQNIATGQRQVLSQFPGINGAPAFSPDGKKLALVLTRTGNPKIYVMDLGSKKLTEITHGYSIDTEPAWAPDGKLLLFTSNRGGNPQIYRYNFASKVVQRLTFDGNYNARSSYLPSEKGMIMMHRATGLFGIASQDLQTGRVEELVQTGFDESPSVSPNGKMVLYATQYGGRGVLAEVSVDGQVKLRLPSGDGSVREPSWSP